ncbi:MAG TPA: histidine kinase dimerization/phospho-acceptor domain-containing protein, partial [Haloferula sp.]
MTVECPSVLTEKALDWIGRGDDSPGTQRWDQYLEAVRLLEQHPAGGWISEDGNLCWVEPVGDHINFVPSSAMDLVHVLLQSSAPPGFHMIPSTSTRPTRGITGVNPFVAAQVPFGSGLRVEVHPTDMHGLAVGIRRQQAWTVILLLSASVISLFGLLFIHRTLRRERLLNEMKSQFVASVSHELRAPVASIRLMADALEAEKVPPETA